MAEIAEVIRKGFEESSSPFNSAIAEKLEKQTDQFGQMLTIQAETMKHIGLIADKFNSIQDKLKDTTDNLKEYKTLPEKDEGVDAYTTDTDEAVKEAIEDLSDKVEEQTSSGKDDALNIIEKIAEQTENDVTLSQKLGKKFDNVAKSFKKGLTTPLGGAIELGLASVGLGGIDETFKISERLAGMITSIGDNQDSEKSNLAKEEEAIDKKADKLKKNEIELEKAKKEEVKKVGIWTRLMRLYQKKILLKHIKNLGKHFKNFSEITDKHFEKSRKHQEKAFSCLCDGNVKGGTKDKAKGREKPDRQVRSMEDYLRRTESPKKDALAEARAKRTATIRENIRRRSEARKAKPKKPSMLTKILKMLLGVGMGLLTKLPMLGAGLATAIGAGLATLGGVLTGAIAGVGSAVKAFGSKAFDILKTGGKKVGEALKTGFTKGKDLLKKGGKGLGKLVGGAGKVFQKVGGTALTGVTAAYGFAKGLGQTEQILGLKEGEEFGTADIIQGGVAKGVEAVANPFAWLADKATGGKYKLQEKVSAQSISKTIDVGRSAAGVGRKTRPVSEMGNLGVKPASSGTGYKPSGKSSAPIDKMLVTSPFGMRFHPIHKKMKMHKGTDIGAWNGTPIKAPYDAEVLYSGQRGTFGNFIWLKHAGGLETSYAHLSSMNVKKGDMVNAGTVIGKVGNTGASAGDHLHWQATLNGNYIDPMGLVGNAIPVKDTGIEEGLKKEETKPAPKISASPMKIADVGLSAPVSSPPTPPVVTQDATKPAPVVTQDATKEVTVSQTATKPAPVPPMGQQVSKPAEQVPSQMPSVMAAAPQAAMARTAPPPSPPANASPPTSAGRRVGIDDPMLALIQVLL
jgi:murein DD-endopeptidase MepM/ murein hydrolase activator NlpD